MTTLPPDTFRFLAQLKKNNHRPWFEANRHRYERIRTGLLEFTAALLARMRTFDPSLAHTQPETCLFRIYRDLRFSKDKTPFKTHFGIAISPNGKNFTGAGYYLHLEPGNSFAAGGSWYPEPRQLYLIRQEIDYNFDALTKIIGAPEFRKYFHGLDREHQLTRPPKGYLPDHPALALLKLKSFTCSAPLSPKILGSPRLLAHLNSMFSALYPFLQFLNTALNDPPSDKISFS